MEFFFNQNHVSSMSFRCECGASYLFQEDAERCCERCSVCDAVKCHSQEMNRAWRQYKNGARLGLCPHPKEEGHSGTCTCMGNKFRVKGSGTPVGGYKPNPFTDRHWIFDAKVQEEVPQKD